MPNTIFPGHIDIVSFEANLREHYKYDGKDAPSQCRDRGSEHAIQFALWYANECNRGTPAQVFIEATIRMMGSQLRNLSNRFTEDGEEMNEDTRDRWRGRVLHDISQFARAMDHDDEDAPTGARMPFAEGGRA